MTPGKCSARAVQTVLRAAGVPNGYERLKDLTRGNAIDGRSSAPLSTPCRSATLKRPELKRMSPREYTGLAAKLARDI